MKWARQYTQSPKLGIGLALFLIADLLTMQPSPLPVELPVQRLVNFSAGP